MQEVISRYAFQCVFDGLEDLSARKAKTQGADCPEPIDPPDGPEPLDRKLLQSRRWFTPAPAEAADFASLPIMLMTLPAFTQLTEYLTAHEPEKGGLLIGPKEHDLVTHFIEDVTARTTGVSYTPNAGWLNEVLKQYVACGLDAKGIAHSHPRGCSAPSYGDLFHVQSTFARAKNAKADVFYLPIVCDGRFHPYVVTRARPNEAQLARLILI